MQLAISERMDYFFFPMLQHNGERLKLFGQIFLTP